MSERKKQIRYNIAAFLLLFSVSFYRQLSLRFLPEDPARTWILYACYVFLLGGWAVSIWLRAAQRSMRVFLVLSAAVMLAGLTIRFLQDTFWQENIMLMRVSGFYVAATILPAALLGLYASLGIGQPDDYRIPWEWFLLILPVVVMTWLTVTDEERHFICYILPEEPQPNLNFHPNTGAFLMLAGGMILIVIRIFVIFRRNRTVKMNRLLKTLIPFFEPIMIFLMIFPFFAVSMRLIPSLAGKEVIEFYAKVYYAEILTWELYIWLGLVPVNIEYRECFEHAAAGMQIICDDGSVLLSETARPVSSEERGLLKDMGSFVTAEGLEMHAHRFRDGLFLWNTDVSGLRSTIEALNQTAETLEQEGLLLTAEIRTKNQEARLSAKNRIYSGLTSEVKRQLQMMKALTEEQPSADDRRLAKLVLLGTYVKRRCNLRLIQRETGEIHPEDLLLSLKDMQRAMALTGIRSELVPADPYAYSPDFSICIFDVLEYLLEQAGDGMETMRMQPGDGEFRFLMTGPCSMLPEEELVSHFTGRCRIRCCDPADGYEVCIREGGADIV